MKQSVRFICAFSLLFGLLVHPLFHGSVETECHAEIVSQLTFDDCPLCLFTNTTDAPEAPQRIELVVEIVVPAEPLDVDSLSAPPGKGRAPPAPLAS